MKVKQITLGSSTLVLAALLTACGGSSSSGVQKPTPLVANTNNSGNHGATNHGNHGANNPAPKWDATVRYASLRNNAIKEAIDYVKNDADVIPKIDGYALTIDGRTQNGDIDLSKYAKGHHKFSVQERVTGSANGVQGSITRNSDVYLFKQDYSLIAGIHNKNMTVKLGNDTEEKSIDDIHFFVRGVPTEKLPTTGKFNYSGSGKIGSQSGVQEVNFNYNVDFGAKTGSGSLGNITLSEGKIRSVKHDDDIGGVLTTQVIEGKATDGSLNGDYSLDFFGPDADEIVGTVELGDDKEGMVGMFGGTKQAK
ncbi:factor H binding protein domain-containing protein [Moraxella nonliquefaciens]|uniref:factor H binding protein domain-containing protein n=1 Tax=Moraxella nonliquefaciens TaxID=478 RepID=UPI00081F2A6D|nr:factor H binding protein domain-containing protein [Moraxella nonliquefaciens]OBX49867.1 hypothetical protein A9Z65_08530 [Moraxella nonliquefaciens]